MWRRNLILGRWFAVVIVTLTAVVPGAHAGNLIPNSSFEAGIDYRLAVGRWSADGISSASLDPTTHVHGGVSLKIPYSRSGLAIARSVTGVDVRSAVPVALEKQRRYTFSIYLKATRPTKGQIVLTRNGARDRYYKPSVTKDVQVWSAWRRFSVTYTPQADEQIYWSVQIQSDRPGHLWLDAAQLTAGSLKEYQPAATLEASLTTNRLGRIFDADETPTLDLIAYNDSPTGSARGQFGIDVFEFDGSRVYSTTVEKTVAARSRTAIKVPVPLNRRGLFRAVMTRPNAREPESELHFSVLPKPRPLKPEQSAFGVYGTISPESLKILRRMGFSWITTLTSNSVMSYWDKVERKRGHFHWYDDRVDMAKAAGFELVFNLEPCRTPKWAKTLGRDERRRLWANFVRAMVRHYGDRVKYWIIGDEVADLRKKSYKRNCWDNAEEYAPWHKAGYDAIKAESPDATVILNAWPGFLRPLFKVLDPATVDVAGANAYHLPEPYLVRYNREAKQFNLNRRWAPGIGFAIEPYYRRHALQRKLPSYRADMWRNVNERAVRGVVTTFSLGYERLFHYNATYVGNTSNYTILEADSGLKPVGVQLAALAWLTDGHRQATELNTRLRERNLRVYRIDRYDGKTIFAVWGNPQIDHRLQLRLADVGPENIVLYDSYTNVVPLHRKEDGIELRIGRDAVFLEVPANEAEVFASAFRSSTYKVASLPKARSVDVKGRYAVVRELKDGLRRAEPNVSLWYNSNNLGWVELLRYRASGIEGRYQATEKGFEVSWEIKPDAGKFYIGLGKFPIDVIDGANVIRRKIKKSGVSVTAARIFAGKPIRFTPVNGNRSGAQSGKLKAVDFLFRLRNGLEVAVDAEEADPHQDGASDKKGLVGWKLYSKGERDIFLHRFFHNMSQGTLTTRIVVNERG